MRGAAFFHLVPSCRAKRDEWLVSGCLRLRLCENSLIRWNLAPGLHARDYMEVTYAQIHRGTRQAPSYLDA
jgi:hypothetical protein